MFALYTKTFLHSLISSGETGRKWVGNFVERVLCKKRVLNIKQVLFFYTYVFAFIIWRQNFLQISSFNNREGGIRATMNL